MAAAYSWKAKRRATSRNFPKSQLRSLRDAAEMQRRCSGDRVDIQRRCSGDAVEMQRRSASLGDAVEISESTAWHLLLLQPY